MEGIYQIHASRLARWAGCERREIWRLHNPDAAEDRTTHVAAWVGTAVHAMLAGDDFPPPKPSPIRFDAVTPTERHAIAQAFQMGQAVRKALTREGWEVLAVEEELPPLRPGVTARHHSVQSPYWPANVVLAGRLDMKVRSAAHGRGIVDLKTGADFSTAWLQMAAYWEMDAEAGDPADFLAVMHAPRHDIGEPAATPQIIRHPVHAGIVKNDLQRLLDRIGEVLNLPDRAVAAPGWHCSKCAHPQCHVRAQPHDGR